MLEARDIYFNIGNKFILNGISSNFEAGLFHVILGPNGSGKSSFLKIFSGELKPGKGSIRYDGKEIFQLNKKAVAQRRAVMSQQPELHFPLTVREIVMMGRYPHFNYKPGHKDENICREVIADMQLDDFLERDYLTLSGGEKQRVQFARVLTQIWEKPATGSRYLFLDEPITSLDIHYQHQFLQMAKALTSQDFIVIAILHDINLAIQYADRVLLLKEGRLVKAGLVSEVITPELITQVFNIEADIVYNEKHNRPFVIF